MSLANQRLDKRESAELYGRAFSIILFGKPKTTLLGKSYSPSIDVAEVVAGIISGALKQEVGGIE